jgi:hypothetical protein
MRDNLTAFWAEFSTYCKAVIVANLIVLHTQPCPQLELKPRSSNKAVCMEMITPVRVTHNITVKPRNPY